MTSIHTFVIPVYGDSAYLEACVQSLLNQSMPGKVLMATSTPTDFSRRLAEQYHIPYFTNTQARAGIAADWNFALSLADTPWVTIAHQDDVYHQDYRLNVVEKVQHGNDILIAFTNYYDLVGEEQRRQSANSLVKRALLLPFILGSAISNRLLKRMMLMPGCPICCPSVVFNKKMLDGFEFNPDFVCALDWEAWLRLASKEGQFAYINKPLVLHRIHANSETVNSIDNGTRKKEEQRILEKLWGKVLAKPLAWLYSLGYRNNKINR